MRGNHDLSRKEYRGGKRKAEYSSSPDPSTTYFRGGLVPREVLVKLLAGEKEFAPSPGKRAPPDEVVDRPASGPKVCRCLVSGEVRRASASLRPGGNLGRSGLRRWESRRGVGGASRGCHQRAP